MVVPFYSGTDSSTIPSGFFAYPSTPASLAETIRNAVKELNQGSAIRLIPWQDLAVSGKVIIDEICERIDGADLFCADVTYLNPNVMFELGYAIGANKRVWLVMDTSIESSMEDFREMRILTTTGYSSYVSSQDLVTEFYNEQPYTDLKNSIYEQSIKPVLTSPDPLTLLYMKSRFDTDASRRISKVISDSELPVIFDDPAESSVGSLSSYSAKLNSAMGLVCHLTVSGRIGSRLHNARYSLVAGIAFGMKVPLIMLEEGDVLAPIDYRDILRQYATSTEAGTHVETWIGPIKEEWRRGQATKKSNKAAVQLARELNALQFGEPIAENEAERLVDEYFIETASFREALKGSNAIFVGRKGAGKSANLLKLADTLRRDSRNLVCEIVPMDYEFQSLIKLLSRYRELDLRSYAIESLWKFLIYTEIANAAIKEIEAHEYQTPTKAELRLLEILDRDDAAFRQEFSIRLERCVESLLSSQSVTENASVENARLAISQSVHDKVLSELRSVLGEVLHKKNRVAVLVDNLDKAWDKRGNLAELSQLLLGLLNVADRIVVDMRSEGFRKSSINLSLSVFLRSDIFAKVLAVAGEPDKIAYAQIDWNDRELLLRVIEERFVASQNDTVDKAQLWERVFCPEVSGASTRMYISKHIIPRPRDLVIFVKAALSKAINRGHSRIEESDVRDGEIEYSQHALETIRVEDGGSTKELDAILFEFLGCRSPMGQTELEALLSSAGVEADSLGQVIDHLCSLSFLGVEVRDNEFRFADDIQDLRKNQVLARRFCEVRGSAPRYSVNKPFWGYLEIDDYYAS